MQIVPAFIAALAWCALIANVIVIPFFSKAEVIFKDLVSSGDRDLALSKIETEKLYPALVDLIEAAVNARERVISAQPNIRFLDVLHEVEVEAHVTRASDALEQKRSIDHGISKLENLSALLWKVGSFHIAFVMAIPATLFFVPTNQWQQLAMFAFFLLALVTLVLILVGLAMFERQRKPLLVPVVGLARQIFVSEVL